LEYWFYLQEILVKASEVDLELEYKVLQTMYEVIIWVQDGLITIPTTLIMRSHNVGFENLERDTYKRATSLNLNLKRIRHYTPYSEPVWPKHRTGVRLIHKLTDEEGLQLKKSYQPSELRLNQEFLQGLHHKKKDQQDHIQEYEVRTGDRLNMVL
jgi:hypothetical protein